MSLKNPTTGNESQFNPTKPMDSGIHTDPNFTFDLIDENPLLKYKNPTKSDVDTLYSTVAPADIISQFVVKSTLNPYLSGIFTQIGIEYANPTTTKVNTAYSTVTPAKIENQFVRDNTTLSKDGTPIYASGMYKETNINDLLNVNPTNPTGSLAKSGLLDSSSISIESQFFSKFYGTGNMQVDMELKDLAGKTKNAFFGNSRVLSFISNIGNLPKNVSKASNITLDRELANPENDWVKAAANVGLNIFGTSTSQYATLNLGQLYNYNPYGLSDFRSRFRSQLQLENILKADIDKLPVKSTSTLTLKHGEDSGLYRQGNDYYQSYAADKSGVYKYYNLNDTYGFGDQGLPSRSVRQDFTKISGIHPEGDSSYKFRGDKITVIQPKLMKYQDAVKHRDAKTQKFSKDLIKFFFTGPKALKNSGEDSVMVFRAIITSLSDTHSPQWNSQQMIGRADPNYHYGSYSRELSLDFTVYASDRDEMKPIWQKLNMLAGYTTPSYGEVAPKAPWMRITIGDLFVQQPAIINSLSYTLHDSDTTWEINIEEDPWMNQLPHKVSVSIGFNLITDYLPQQNGRFYTLNENNQYDWLRSTTNTTSETNVTTTAVNSNNDITVNSDWEPPNDLPVNDIA